MAGKTYEIAFNLAAKLGSSFSSAFSGASQKLATLQTNVKATKASMRELEMQQRKGVISTLEYAASYEKLTVQLHKAEQMQTKLAKSQALQNRVSGVGDKARSVAGTAAAAGAVLAVPGAAAVNFDYQMAYVAKQVDNARDDLGNLTAIGQQAKQDILTMSRDLMIMPDEVAKAYAFSARAGVKGMENLQRMTTLGVMMGTAFELPAEQVATDMAKIGNALGYNLETAEGIAQLESLADRLNYLDDQTIATGDELIDYMKRTAGVIKGLVPTMTEGFNMGLGAGFVSAGEKAEVASRAINVMLTRFAAAPTESKDFQAALEVIGLTAEKLQAGMIRDADSAILDLFNRVKNLDEATRNNVLAELIGKDHIDTVAKLAGNYDKFLASIKLANSEAAKGSVRKEFEILSKTSKRQLEGTSAALAKAGGALGEGLLPSLNEKAQGLANLAETVGRFAREHPALTSAVMTGAASLVGFALVASAVTWVLTSAIAPFIAFRKWAIAIELATKIATATQWLFNASLLGCPVTWILLGIAAIVAAGWALYQNWDTVIKFFQDKFQWLEDKWIALKDRFSTGITMPVTMPIAGGIGDMPIAENAVGGIYGRGAFLTTFAERSAESAIPIDGSRRSLGLWAKTGEMLGVSGGGGINLSFAPIINLGGGADAGDVQRVLENEREKFRRMLADLAVEARRLSYA
jgi:TP901 family phage tail tape measure protein